MTVRDLLSRADSEELSEWMAFDVVEGIPDPHFGPAMITSAVVNVHGGKSKPSDFYPVKPLQPKQSTEEMRARFDAFVSAGKARAEARKE